MVTVDASHAGFITNLDLECCIDGKAFRFADLYVATDGFSVDRLLGHGGFGQVYKGFYDGTNEVGSYHHMSLLNCMAADMFMCIII